MFKRIAMSGWLGLMMACSIGMAADAGFFFHPGDTVVFLGDSITEQRLYTTYIEAYTLTRFPQQSFIFRNAGWNGDTSWLRMRAHPNEPALFAANDSNQQAMIESAVGAGLKRDILPVKPTAVTVDFGMNDHAYQAFRPDIFKAYSRSQTEIVKMLKQNGARVALLTPQPIEDHRADPDKDLRNQSLRQFSDGLKIVASNEGALFVDQFSPYMALMLNARATNLNAMIGGGDAIHPGPAGHTLMAWAILKGLGAPAEVSSVEFDLTRSFWHQLVRAENCKVSKAAYTQGTLSFLRTDVALPMPIDLRAMPALTKAPVLNDLNRYELKVAGLKSDRYEVRIDGESVVTTGKDDLAKGLNLAVIAGPISRQALEVLSLVVQKNNLYYERWRKCQLSPIAANQARIPALDSQIAALEKQIDAARQPKPHRFEVAPVVK